MKIKILFIVFIVSFYSFAEARDVKICYPAYGVNMVVYFDSAGIKHEITNTAKIADYLKKNVDFFIEGRLAGNDYSLSRVVPSLMYLHGTCFIPYMLNSPKQWHYPMYRLISQNPHWKMKYQGEQLYRNGYAGFELLDISNTDWQNAMASHIKSVLDTKTFFTGVFLDETFGHFNSKQFGFRKIKETAVVEETVDADRRAVKVKNTMYQSKSDCSKVTVTKSDGASAEIIGVWAAMKCIYIKPSVNAGEKVIVTYYGNAAWTNPTDEQWTNWEVSLLSKVRQAIGTKLIIYNGTQLGYDYDTKFLQYADGCMREGFMNWGVDSEAKWKQDIEKLSAISNHKMYFALVVCNKNNDAEIKKHMQFSYASFLLGREANAYYGFAVEPNEYQKFYFNTMWNKNVGAPVEICHEQKPHVFEREYTNAYVVVNMADVEESIIIPSRYTIKDINKVTIQTIQLSPKSGKVLYNDTTHIK
jgi:hypothetical protein